MINCDTQKILQAILCLLISLCFTPNLLAQEGNVGIGTTTPQAKLHIAGDLQVEDLSGNGERTLVATPEGKLKAVTNSQPNPSNQDTLRAKFIELIDDEGDTKFIFNAHTGEFQMMDNDTVWYEMEVNSPPNQEIILDNETVVAGEIVKNTLGVKEFEKIVEVFSLISKELSDTEAASGRAACLRKARDILIEETPTQLKESSRSAPSLPGGIAPPDRFTTLTIANTSTEASNSIEVVTRVNGLSSIEKPDIDIISVKISGKCICSFGTEEIPSEDETNPILVAKNQSPASTTTAVFNQNQGTIISKTESGFNENNQPFESLTDSEQGLNNTQFPGSATITDANTGNEISTRIDENGRPSFKIGVGSGELIISSDEISQTDESGNSISAKINEIIQTTSEITTLSEEQITQNNQINQNASDIENLGSALVSDIDEVTNNITDIEENVSGIDNRLTDVENNGNGGGGGSATIAEEFTASKDGSTNKLKPELVELTAADGNTAEFKKDGIVFEGPDGTTFFIDCNAISKFKPDKSAAFVGMDFNLNDEAFDVFADLNVFGDFTEVGKKINKIDHPNDPTNQYLQHTFVGTNELLNEYSGNTTTDSNGKAIVQLPSYVETLNTDFRYQLTVIGSFAQAIVAKEITDNQFIIQTSKPNMKVSWEIKGVRQDTYAQQNPLEVEIIKENTEIGTTLYDANSKSFTPNLNRKMVLQQKIETADVE